MAPRAAFLAWTSLAPGSQQSVSPASLRHVIVSLFTHTSRPCSAVRTTHQSFSDFPIILSKIPFVGSQMQPADPAGLLHTIARLSASFLLSGIPDFPDPKGMRPADMGNVETEPVGKKGKERQQIVGAHGEVRVHFGETATSEVDSLTLQGEEKPPKT